MFIISVAGAGVGIAFSLMAAVAEPTLEDSIVQNAAPSSEIDITDSDSLVRDTGLAVPGSTVIAPPTETAVHETDSLPGVAVMSFIGRGVDSLIALGFSDRFGILLSNNCALPVMEPPALNNALLKRGWKGDLQCDHNDCFIEAGRFLGIRYIIGGSVGKIDGMYNFAIRMIDVSSGKVLLFKLVDIRQPIQEILNNTLPPLASEFSNKLSCPHSATVAIQTDPANATVALNETTVGTTPLLLKNVREGHNLLRIKKKNYREFTDTLILEKGRPVVKRYSLQFTDSYIRASVNRQRAKWMSRFIGISGSIASLSVGFYYNSKLPAITSKQERIVDEYEKGDHDADASLYTERLKTQSKLFDTWSAYRNACYVAGAVLAVGVTATFFF